MADTIRESIIQDLVAQLETLTPSGYGYVYRGRTYFEYADLPCISLLPGVESSSRSYGEQQSTMPVTVHAIQVVGDNDPSVLAETILGVLIENIIGGRSNISNIDDIRYTGGGVEDYPAEDEQAISVLVNLEVDYSTNLGDPYTQSTL
jgi:hypothetical protein